LNSSTSNYYLQEFKLKMQLLLLFTAAVLALPTAVSSLALLQLSKRDSITVAQPTSGLPAPSTISPAVSLKYIGLAIGTQNYTCAATPNSASGVPVSIGAKANLYDAGTFLQSHPDMISTLPGLALGYQTMSGDDISTLMNMPLLGHHFFNAALQATFDLTAVNAKLVAKKLNDIPAPTSACPGPDGAGAVDWLELVDVGSGASSVITYAYRIETAGGMAPATCTNQSGTFQVEYSAEYWFYGP
jgi:hypothetical protein